MILGLDLARHPCPRLCRLPPADRANPRLPSGSSTACWLRGARPARKRAARFRPGTDFQAIDTWLNSEPLTLAGLRGKVVLIDFWTYSLHQLLAHASLREALGRDLPRGGSSSSASTRRSSPSSASAGTSSARSTRSTSSIQSRSTTSSAPGRRGGIAIGRRSTSSTAGDTSATPISAKASTSRART